MFEAFPKLMEIYLYNDNVHCKFPVCIPPQMHSIMVRSADATFNNCQLGIVESPERLVKLQLLMTTSIVIRMWRVLTENNIFVSRTKTEPYDWKSPRPWRFPPAEIPAAIWIQTARPL